MVSTDGSEMSSIVDKTHRDKWCRDTEWSDALADVVCVREDRVREGCVRACGLLRGGVTCKLRTAQKRVKPYSYRRGDMQAQTGEAERPLELCDQVCLCESADVDSGLATEAPALSNRFAIWFPDFLMGFSIPFWVGLFSTLTAQRNYDSDGALLSHILRLLQRSGKFTETYLLLISFNDPSFVVLKLQLQVQTLYVCVLLSHAYLRSLQKAFGSRGHNNIGMDDKMAMKRPAAFGPSLHRSESISILMIGLKHGLFVNCLGKHEFMLAVGRSPELVVGGGISAFVKPRKRLAM
ncbi:hypothetical protein Tco_1402410 [Tanacetum coccineum]